MGFLYLLRGKSEKPPSNTWQSNNHLLLKGNNGLSGFNFGPSQFQNLLYLAGYDPAFPPYEAPCGSSTGCVLPYLGSVRDGLLNLLCNNVSCFLSRIAVNSIVLLTNGISFALQAVLLLIIGAWSDFGTWRPNITIFFTIAAVAVSFAWLGVEHPDQWRAGVALYVLGCTCMIFFYKLTA